MFTTETRNLIAHYENGNSDKVYMACIKETTEGYEVIGKWGRRGRALTEQSKGTYSSLSGATQAASELFHTKTKKGYVDIDSSNYSGPVTRASMEAYTEEESTAQAELNKIKNKAMAESETKKEAKPELSPSYQPGEEFVAKCLDNTGMEDYFETGITYMAEYTKVEDIYKVYDKFGESRECFSDRFEVTEED